VFLENETQREERSDGSTKVSQTGEEEIRRAESEERRTRKDARDKKGKGRKRKREDV